MKQLFTISILIGLLMLNGCTQQPTWTLIFYPDGENNIPTDKTQFIEGYYKTLEQCNVKGHGMQRLSRNSNATYECAYLCKLQNNSLSCERYQPPQTILKDH